ncbi:MAG TPA: hypothetical protein PJ983_13055, partial [Flavobacteriales bacterium]|nr:hypothetical protein [Flavobacteriales bacterium]
MDRKQFLLSLTALPLTGMAMKLNDLATLGAQFHRSERMPVLFLGHGSPMNALAEDQLERLRWLLV